MRINDARFTIVIVWLIRMIIGVHIFRERHGAFSIVEAPVWLPNKSGL
eukprot:COSAG01_NODE_7559_length_3150_cov_1.656506_1_plen_47_part_10